jgi:hypothetical protein
MSDVYNSGWKGSSQVQYYNSDHEFAKEEREIKLVSMLKTTSSVPK